MAYVDQKLESSIQASYEEVILVEEDEAQDGISEGINEL